jgi:hypothetical protein
VVESNSPTLTDALASPDRAGEPGSCGSALLWIDYAPTDVKTLVGRGLGFVVARVSSSEPAFFNTADGSAPDGFMTKGSGPTTTLTTVFTPYVVDVDQVLSRRGDVGERRVLVEGGAVGCILVTVEGTPKLRVSRSYVLVLADAKDVDGNDLIGLERVVFAWPIGSSGIVATVDGPLTIESLRDIVAAAELDVP